MVLLGLILGIATAAGLFATPVDAVAYWESGTSDKLYPTSWSEVGRGYLFYPPVIAQVSSVLQPVGWPAFIIAMYVATFWSIWFCARQWSWVLLAIGIPFYFGIGPDAPSVFLSYALLGNLHWILAAVTVLALSYPVLYPVLVLSKMTIAIGWLWHVFRAEWRKAAVGAGATIVVALVSFAWNPAVWWDFGAFAIRNMLFENSPLPLFPVPFWARLPMAVALVFWGARGNHRWVVPVAAGWALPALYGLGFLPFWVAATRLVDRTAAEALASSIKRIGRPVLLRPE